MLLPAQSRPRHPWMPNLRAMLTLNTAIAIGVTLLFVSIEPENIHHLGHLLAMCLIYSHVIGTLASYTASPAGHRLYRLPRWQFWMTFVPLLAVLGLGGALLATTLCWVVGLIRSSEWPAVAQSSGLVAAVVTSLVGVVSVFFDEMRGRVQLTSLELRTQQLHREQAEKLAAESRLEALHSRLQPHFVFNTINSVLALIREDPAAAERMLERLARLLRFALEAQDRTVIRLDEELRLVRDYLEIERTRFGERLTYQIDAPDELAALSTPPYALQTLVENSVKFAVSPRRSGGRVLVRAARYRDTLALEVRDDGPGFDRSALLPGHGIEMLERRLAAVYGDEAFLEIENDSGAIVRMRLPCSSAGFSLPGQGGAGFSLPSEGNGR